MTRRAKVEQASGYTVLLVDDNPDYLQATRLLLEREGHNVLTATNGPEALGILPQQKVDLLLLDYFMPGMTGEQVVAEIRKFDPYVQVILQTGYASEQPPRELLHRLNIQGYYDKTEGPEQLLLWTTVGLKAAFTIQLLFKNRHGVAFILDKTPDLHRMQGVDELSQVVMQQLTSLLATVGAGSDAAGFLATLDASSELILRAGTGAFATKGKVRDLVDPEKMALIDLALQEAQVQVSNHGTILPLRLGPLTVGVICIDQLVVADQTLELARMLANQAAAALQNAQLYELATIDVLTGTYVPSFFEQALFRELAAGLRGHEAVALLLVDVDGMKVINAKAGHLAGDQALAALGGVLRQVTRAGDSVGRYGGDVFGIILRDPVAAGPLRLGARIQELLKDQMVVGAQGEAPLRVSIGFSLIEAQAGSGGHRTDVSYFRAVAQALEASALAALDEARQAGGAAVRGSAPLAWPEPGQS
jgi:two-component system, cell cycle response regulator